jgi:outer membrane protein TolC
VDRGRAEVALIQAENLYATERLRLLQTIGIDIGREVELTSTFAVFEPQWEVEELTDAALRGHPRVVSAKKAEAAANHATRGAWTSYLPSLNLQGGWTGFVRKSADNNFLITSARQDANDAIQNCDFWNTLSAGLNSPLPGRPQDCSSLSLTPADEANILASNERFPFDYTPSPASFQVQVTVPIFNRFQRERQVQTARVFADDAKHQRRAEELARSTEVATALLTLKTAYRTVQIEERNAAAAAEQLEIARERYRLGAGCGAAALGTGQPTGLCTTFLELTRAQETKVRADQAHLAATYTFHITLATLEAAVGRPLR